MHTGDLRIVRIVVCSPSDVSKERKLIQELAAEVNRNHANTAGLELKYWGWETDTYPAFHIDGPQGHIDQLMQIENCDVVIGIFWKRFGTPTMDSGSGTAHELNKAYQAWRARERPELMLYFKNEPYLPKNTEELMQLKAVLEFKEKLPEQGLQWHYETVESFEQLIRGHLHKLVDKFSKANSDATSTTTDNTTIDLFDAPTFADAISRTSIDDELDTAINTAPVVVVGGLSGIGKTYAVSKFLSTRRSKEKIIWYDAKQGEVVERLLEELHLRLNFTTQSTHSRCKEICAKLREKQLLLVIDDFQSADEESFRPLITSAIRQPSPAIILFITQRVSINFLSSGTICQINSKGFSIAEAKKYITKRGLPPSKITDLTIDLLIEMTGGLPLAISLFCTLIKEYNEDPIVLLSGQMRGQDTLDAWFNRIISLVTGPSLQLLQLLSLLQIPFNTGMIKLMSGLAKVGDHESILRDLQRAYLVQKYTRYLWKTHDLVAARCRDMLDPTVRRNVYQKLSKHFMRGYPRRKPSDILPMDEYRWKSRALDQLMQSDSYLEDAQKLFQMLVATAKAVGHYTFIITHCELFRQSLPSRNRWIDYHCAHAYLICGAAQRCFELMDKLLREEQLSDPNAELACRRLHAEALFALGRTQEALARINGALEEPVAKEANHPTRAQARSTLAFMNIMAGQIDNGIKIAETLLVEATKLNSRRGAAVASSLIGQGKLHTNCPSDAAAYLKNANSLFEECEDKRGLAWTCALLAECFLRLDDHNAALQSLLDAAQICANIGECSTDYLLQLERLERLTEKTEIHIVIDDERDRISDWETALPISS